MNSLVISVVTVCTAVGSGVVAGVFFGFSTFVMPALARLPVEQGILAMQSINVMAINKWFMGVMFGAAATSLLLVIAPFLGWSGPGNGLRVTGGLMYLLGIVVVTIAFNVPRNDALAALSAGASEAAGLWPRFLVEWTRWNHVRTATGIVATVLLVASLAVRSSE